MLEDHHSQHSQHSDEEIKEQPTVGLVEKTGTDSEEEVEPAVGEFIEPSVINP